MYSSMQTQTNSYAQLDERDMLTLLLSNQKRVAQVYTIATIEANCPYVRQVFQSLTQEALYCQETVYNIMKQLNYYGSPMNATRQEISQAIQEYQIANQQVDQQIQKQATDFSPQQKTYEKNEYKSMTSFYNQ